MQLLFLREWFSDEVLKALCWTFVHSLWQGLIAAALAGIIIVTTRKSPARLRYNSFGILLVLFLATFAYTLHQQLENVTFANPVSYTLVETDNANFRGLVNEPITTVSSIESIDVFIRFLNRNAGLFMLVWAAFFLVHCIKIFTGLAGINRLRNHNIHSGGEWQEKLNGLSKSIGIKQSIKLFQSELVNVPIAAGFFKPVILVPLGLLSHLPPDQVETILLHELAHIRRRDYLMNILQRFAEAVFFFNPGMLWISSLIRQEREACCDDIVVANTHYKGSYLEALVSFQEYSLSTTGYAMAIGTKRHYLLNRVKRMLTRENKKLNLMEKILLLAGLVIFTAFSFIPRKEVIAQQPVRQASKRSEEVKPIEPVKPSAAPTNINLTRKPAPARKPVTSKEVAEGQDQISVSIDSVPPVAKEKPATEELSIKSASTNINDDGKTKTADITVVDQEGKTYKITKLNDKVTSLAIDGRSIPQNEISNYSSTIDRIDRALEKNRAEKEKNRQIRQAEAEKRREENKERQAEARERKEDSRKRQEEARERTEESRQRTAEQRKEKERSEKDRDKREDTDKKLKETQKRVEVQRTTIERKKKELEKDQKEINKKGKFLLNEREVVDNNHNLDFKVQSDILLKNEANINLDKKIALQSNNNHDVNLKLANSLHTESILTKKLILNNNVNIDAKSEHKFNLQLKINVDSTHKRIKSAKPCKEAPTKIVEPVTKQRNSSEPSVPPARKPVKPRYSIEV